MSRTGDQPPGEPLSQVLCDRQERQVSVGDEVIRYSDSDLNLKEASQATA